MRAHLKMDGKFMQNGSDSIDILSISTPQKSLSSAIKTASEVMLFFNFTFERMMQNDFYGHFFSSLLHPAG